MIQIAGWGTTEDHSPSTELLEVTMDYLDFPTCHKKASEEFRKYLSVDKFCAPYKNGIGLGNFP